MIHVKNKDYTKGIAAMERLGVINPEYMKDPYNSMQMKAFKQLRTKERKRLTKKISIGIAALAVVATIGYVALQMNQKKN